ncbi:unnamed protein product [Orchesella dallaii]|uniref:Helicase ATP-binding domain-containing protein n=1 Tax=Orchesella dallaii TaxID=48710 RepID=A0ABP1S1I4_9HEXA
MSSDEGVVLDAGEADALITSRETVKFTNYKPAFGNPGQPHPYQLCEGSVLSCVRPPPVTYLLKMEPKFYCPANTSVPAHMSDAQLEAVIYACQAHEKMIECFKKNSSEVTLVRQGFFLGDGTGTGKSRVLAAIMYETILSGISKVIYVTANELLFKTMKPEIQYFLPQQKFISLKELEKYESQGDRKEVLLLTYSNLSDTLKQGWIVKWIGNEFDGMIVFDEAHNAKAAFDSVKPSAAGRMVDRLQRKNPMARIVYSSATGASEPFHLLYMSRLGILGPNCAYETPEDFCTQIEKKGVVALELVAVEMKMRGVFLSRMVSLENIEVFVEAIKPKDSFLKIYERCSQLWLLLLRFVEMKKNAIRAANDENKRGKTKLSITLNSKSGVLHSGAQNFFATIIMSSKVEHAAKLTRNSLRERKSVIIGLQNTGESQFKDFVRESWNEGRPYSFASESLRMTMEKLGINVGCPKVYMKDGSIVKIGKWTAKQEEIYNMKSVSSDFNEFEEEVSFSVRCSKKAKLEESSFAYWPKHSVGHYWTEVPTPEEMSWSFNEVAKDITSEGLARLFHELAPLLPINALDELGVRIGHDKIAEVTGRNGSYIFNSKSDKWEKASNAKKETSINDFMDGKKKVCVISGAGSTGHSLHSDKARKNQDPRIHITLQYAWSPDQLLQQIGRSHRSNQANLPTYFVIKSAIPGEVRFIAIVGKRLDQLGAICKGQAKASPLDECLFDCTCTDVGVKAYNTAIYELSKNERINDYLELVEMTTIGNKKTYYTKTNDESMCRGFNRLLLLPIEIQKNFMDLLYEEIKCNKSAIYTPLIEIPGKGSAITQKQFEEIFVNEEAAIQVHTFQINRVATLDFIKGIIDGLNSQPRFYTRGFDTMLAVELAPDEWIAYFPYSTTPQTVSREFLSTWNVVKKEDFLHYWNLLVLKLLKNPGCLHIAKGAKCKPTWAKDPGCRLPGRSTPTAEQAATRRDFDLKKCGRLLEKEKADYREAVVSGRIVKPWEVRFEYLNSEPNNTLIKKKSIKDHPAYLRMFRKRPEEEEEDVTDDDIEDDDEDEGQDEQDEGGSDADEIRDQELNLDFIISEYPSIGKELDPKKKLLAVILFFSKQNVNDWKEIVKIKSQTTIYKDYFGPAPRKNQDYLAIEADLKKKDAEKPKDKKASTNTSSITSGWIWKLVSANSRKPITYAVLRKLFEASKQRGKLAREILGEEIFHGGETILNGKNKEVWQMPITLPNHPSLASTFDGAFIEGVDYSGKTMVAQALTLRSVPEADEERSEAIMQVLPGTSYALGMKLDRLNHELETENRAIKSHQAALKIAEANKIRIQDEILKVEEEKVLAESSEGFGKAGKMLCGGGVEGIRKLDDLTIALSGFWNPTDEDSVTEALITIEKIGREKAAQVLRDREAQLENIGEVEPLAIEDVDEAVQKKRKRSPEPQESSNTKRGKTEKQLPSTSKDLKKASGKKEPKKAAGGKEKVPVTTEKSAKKKPRKKAAAEQEKVMTSSPLDSDKAKSAKSTKTKPKSTAKRVEEPENPVPTAIDLDNAKNVEKSSRPEMNKGSDKDMEKVSNSDASVDDKIGEKGNEKDQGINLSDDEVDDVNEANAINEEEQNQSADISNLTNDSTFNESQTADEMDTSALSN